MVWVDERTTRKRGDAEARKEILGFEPFLSGFVPPSFERRGKRSGLTNRRGSAEARERGKKFWVSSPSSRASFRDRSNPGEEVWVDEQTRKRGSAERNF